MGLDVTSCHINTVQDSCNFMGQVTMRMNTLNFR